MNGRIRPVLESRSRAFLEVAGAGARKNNYKMGFQESGLFNGSRSCLKI